MEETPDATEGLQIPAIVLPESSDNLDMIGLIVYNGNIYTQTATKMDAASAKAVLGTKLGTTKGNIDEWSKQDEYAVEFASTTIGEADVYSVQGYDQTFRIMTYYESESKVYTEFYECLNGITVLDGEDVFRKLQMTGNILSTQYRSHSDWYYNVDNYYPLDDMDLINLFVEELNHTVPYTGEIVEEKLGDFRNDEHYREMILHLKDGSKISLVVLKDGYIRYGNSNLYFKMESEIFKQIWDELQHSEKTELLSFQLVNPEQQIQLITSIENANIIKEQSVTGGAIIIYSKNDDNEFIFGAYQTNEGTLYDLGAVGGMSPQLDDELLSIKELSLFNKSLVRIKGVFGANAPIQNYYSIEDGRLIPFLRVDTGHAEELDLDGDGTVEIVSSHGTPIHTYIYKWADGKFSVVNVNESLNAVSVFLDEDNSFNVQLEIGSNLIKQYEYKSGILKPINSEVH
jgi:hypothetical protein